MPTWMENVEYYQQRYPKTFKWLGYLTGPCCCCFVLPLYCSLRTPIHKCGNGYRSYREAKARRVTSIHLDKKGPRDIRHNSLSEGAPIGTRTKRSRKPISSQASSPLFSKLPYEIREAIFSLTLVGTGAVYVYEDHWAQPFMYPRFRPFDPERTSLIEARRFRNHPPERQPDLALLRTCRRVYIEAVSLFYSKNQFYFEQDMLPWMLQIFPKIHFEHIRSMRLVFGSSIFYEEIIWDADELGRRLGQDLRSWHHLRLLDLVYVCKADGCSSNHGSEQSKENYALRVHTAASFPCNLRVSISHICQ